MSELPASIADRLDVLAEEGNVLLEERGDWAGAVAVWRRALALLPAPQDQWEASLWLNTSIGEALRAGGDLQGARTHLFDALNAPDGHMNPFTLLRLGQTLLELGE